MNGALRDGRVAVGIVILAVLTVLALGAPWLAPADPVVQGDIVATRFLAPLATGPDGVFHLLGTDRFGRDVWSRLLFGARVSLAVGSLAVVLAVLLGAAIGAAAGWIGGWIDRGLMAATDAALAVPRVVLLLLLVATWPPSVPLVVVVLGVTGWMPIARLVRAEVMAAAARPYAEAARALGARPRRVLLRHVLPNAVTPALTAAALAVGNAIMLEAGLSFLGLGVQPPTPSWGNMIASGRDALVNAPWIATAPGLAVALVTLACNLLGDGLRDRWDPRGG